MNSQNFIQSEMQKMVPVSDEQQALIAQGELINEQLDKKEGQEIGIFARVLDVGTGVVSGVLRAAESVGELGDDVGGAIARRIMNPLDAEARQESKEKVEKLQEENPTVVKKLSDTINPKTTPGKIIEPLTQFLVPFSGVNKVVKGGGIVKAMATGGVTDLVAFDGQEERLSNLIQQVPELRNPITDFLEYKEDDGKLESRLKNVLEGMLLGVGVDAGIGVTSWLSKAGSNKTASALAKTLRSIRDIRESKKVAKESAESFKKVDEEAKQAIDDLDKTVKEATGTPKQDTLTADDTNKSKSKKKQKEPSFQMSDELKESSKRNIDSVSIKDQKQAASDLDDMIGDKDEVMDELKSFEPLLNKVTLNQEEATTKVLLKIDNLYKSIEKGSMTLDDGLQTSLADINKIDNTSKDFFTSVARVLGRRGHSKLVQFVNKIKDIPSDLPPGISRKQAHEKIFERMVKASQELARGLAKDTPVDDMSPTEKEFIQGLLNKKEDLQMLADGIKQDPSFFNKAKMYASKFGMTIREAYTSLLLSSPETIYWDFGGGLVYQGPFLATERLAQAGVGAARKGIGKAAKKLNVDQNTRVMRWLTNPDQARAKEALIMMQTQGEFALNGLKHIANTVVKKPLKDVMPSLRDDYQSKLSRSDDSFSQDMSGAKTFSSDYWNASNKSFVGRIANVASLAFYARSAQKGIDDVKNMLLWNAEKNAVAYRTAMAEQERYFVENAGQAMPRELFDATLKHLRDMPYDMHQSPKKLQEHIENFQGKTGAFDPRIGMAKHLTDYTEKHTFTNPLEKGSISDHVIQAIEKVPMSWTIFPFKQTMTKVLGRIIDRNPLVKPLQVGMIETTNFFAGPNIGRLKNEFLDDLREGGAKGDERIAQMAVGSAMTMAGYWFVKNKVLTGTQTKLKKNEKNILAGAGIRPYHINIGDKSYNISRLDPIASMFLPGILIHEVAMDMNLDQSEEMLLVHDPETLMKKYRGDSTLIADVASYMSSYALAYGQASVFDKTFFKNASDVLEAMTSQDGDRMERILQNIGTNFVTHRGLAYAMRGTESTIKEVDSLGQSILNQHGIGKYNRRNILGEEIKREKRAHILFPIALTEDKPTPIFDEFIEQNFAPSVIGKHISKVKMTPDEYNRLNDIIQYEVGGKGARELLSEFMLSDVYQQAEEVEQGGKKTMLTKMIRDIKKDARYRLIWDNVHGEDLRNRIDQHYELIRKNQKRNAAFMQNIDLRDKNGMWNED